jgi:putative tryptophan/tyrosine transport system substrate-binding protein
MKRREFIGLIGATALSFPRPGLAQISTVLPVVGVVVPGAPDSANGRIAALRKGLQDEGFVEGTNYSLALRFANGDLDRVPALAKDLGTLKPRVIVAGGTVVAVHKVLPDIPTVFTGFSADPIALGFAESYGRPGGMVTGNVLNAIGGEEALTEKRIGFFKELVPNLKRLGIIASMTNPVAIAELRALETVAGRLGFELARYRIQTVDDVEHAFASGLLEDMSAFYISGEPLLAGNLSIVAPLAVATGKPILGVYPEWSRAGVLMSYSSDLADGYRRAGTYVAKILRGARPGDLPIEQASKFVLVVNLKTAKTLGITVPPTLLALADEVIE